MSQDETVRDLEDVLQTMVRHARIRNRDLARGVHPRLDPTAYPLVVTLAHRGALRASELAAELVIDKSTVSRQIDAVGRLGLLERVADPDDARARLVRLTSEGQEAVESQLRRQRQKLWDALRAWDEDDLREFTILLRRMVDSTAPSGN